HATALVADHNYRILHARELGMARSRIAALHWAEHVDLHGGAVRPPTAGPWAQHRASFTSQTGAMGNPGLLHQCSYGNLLFYCGSRTLHVQPIVSAEDLVHGDCRRECPVVLYDHVPQSKVAWTR